MTYYFCVAICKGSFVRHSSIFSRFSRSNTARGSSIHIDVYLHNSFISDTILVLPVYRLGIFFQSIFDVNSQVTWNTKLVTFIVSYGIAKCKKEITRGSVMCRYLTTNELIYDRMNTLYNTISFYFFQKVFCTKRTL